MAWSGTGCPRGEECLFVLSLVSEAKKKTVIKLHFEGFYTVDCAERQDEESEEDYNDDDYGGGCLFAPHIQHFTEAWTHRRRNPPINNLWHRAPSVTNVHSVLPEVSRRYTAGKILHGLD